MNCRATISSLGALALVLSPDAASAEAWTQGKGERLSIYSFLYGAADRRIGGGDADFRKYEFGYYTEYGVLDRFTAVFRGPVRQAEDGDQGGFGGEAELYGRYQAVSRDRFKATVSLGAGYGVADLNARDVARAYDGWAVEVRGAAGWGADRWFAQGAVGRRFIEGDGADEWRLDGTLGLKPWSKYEVYLRTGSTWRAADGDRSADQFHKLQATGVRKLGAYRIEFGGGAAVLGDGAPAERFATLALWRSF
ncbi:MAG: hypothetical protein AAFR11_12300 [Pseudomonadota bacterium]